VLFAGDIAFHYVVPGPFDCHVSGWIRVCDRAAELDVEVIVPGHGPIGAKSEMREMRDYLAHRDSKIRNRKNFCGTCSFNIPCLNNEIPSDIRLFTTDTAGLAP